MRLQIYLFILFLLFSSQTLHAEGHQSGATLSYPLITKDPTDLHGARFSFWHEWEALTWQHWRIFFDGSLGYWWVDDDSPHDKINIFSLAPIFRFYMMNHPYFSPFIDISIGFSILSATRLDDRNLGMYFSFQDQLGAGISFGANKNLQLSASALHYSNGSLAGCNAGITVPLLINVGYRF